MKTLQTISAGDVIRWFCVDWEFFGEARVATNFHDEIFDICLSMKGVKEVNSGHTGVNVAFENSERTDRQIIEEIKRRLTPIRNACVHQAKYAS